MEGRFTHMAEGILTILLMILFYIGIPALIIVLIVRRKKNPVPRAPKKYKILSPLPIIINIPAAFALAWEEHTGNPLEHEEFWNALLCIMMVVTIVWSLIECRFAGLWIGPLRFVIGACAGILGSAAVVIVLGLLLVGGVGGVGGKSRGQYVEIYGERHYLTPNGGNQYIDGAGNVFISIGPGRVRDVWDNVFDVYTD